MSTLGEFIELPDLVRFPELQPFITAAFLRVHAIAPSTDADANAVRSALGLADVARQQAAFAAVNRIDTALMAALGGTSPAARRFVIGSIVAQIGYNAATFRDEKIGQAAQIVAQYLDVLPAGDPLRQSAGLLYGLQPDDFASQRKLATAFVITALHLAQPSVLTH